MRRRMGAYTAPVFESISERLMRVAAAGRGAGVDAFWLQERGLQREAD